MERPRLMPDPSGCDRPENFGQWFQLTPWGEFSITPGLQIGKGKRFSDTTVCDRSGPNSETACLSPAC